VLAFLGKKPPEKWADENLPVAEWRLAEFAKRVAEIERLRHAYQDKRRGTSEEFEAVLLRLVSRERGELEKLLYVTPLRREAIAKIQGKLRSEIAAIKDPDLQLLLLAELASDILQMATAVSGKVHSKDVVSVH